jgi:hypothetical protein
MNIPRLLELSGRRRVWRETLALGALSVLALATVTAPAKATTILNGSFENTNGATSSYEIDSTNLPGWTNGSSNPQLLNCVVISTDIGDPCGLANGNVGDVFWTNPTVSPDGGNFIAIDSDSNFSVALSQTLTGLVVGGIYDISFYQGAAEFKAVSGPTTDFWAVTFGGQTLDSTTMSDANKGVVPWQAQTLQFTATSTSQLLTFFAVGTPSGGPPTALLDGVTISTQTIQSIPEPSTWALVSTALVGFVVLRRRHHKRS